MKSSFLILCFFLLCGNLLYSQMYFTGKVVDKITKEGLTNCTIKIGEKISVTDEHGYFNIPILEDSPEKTEVTISYIGYKNLLLHKIDLNKFSVIELEHNNNQLSDVIIYSGAKEIIAKAIRKIPINYPISPYNYKGFQRSCETINDSIYFLRDDALLNIYTPSYQDYKNKIEIRVIQNRKYLKDFNKNQKKIAEEKFNWYGTYYLVSDFDFVKRKKSLEEDINDLSLFNYDLEGIIDYHGYKVYAIYRTAIDENRRGFNTTFLIDTATYAFVNVYSVVNKASIKKMSQKDKGKDFYQSQTINYSKIGDKWFLHDLHLEAYVLREKKSLLIYGKTKIDFVTINIDTMNMQPINGNERIGRNTYMTHIKKHVSSDDWQQIDSLISQPEYSKYITDLSMPIGSILLNK